MKEKRADVSIYMAMRTAYVLANYKLSLSREESALEFSSFEGLDSTKKGLGIMGRYKRWLEDISVKMGLGGEITPQVEKKAIDIIAHLQDKED